MSESSEDLPLASRAKAMKAIVESDDDFDAAPSVGRSRSTKNYVESDDDDDNTLSEAVANAGTIDN